MADPLDILSRLARAERGSLARVARAEGASAEDAVDCVQDALCTLLRMAAEGRVPDEVSEWTPLLAGIVRNAARNLRRRHFRARPHEPLDAEALTASDALSTDDVLGRAEDHVRLRACIDDLCEIQRAVVMLRMLEERPGEDVAETLGISPGYVAVLLHRAKSALHSCMTG